jgi:protein disulfide-isomerase A4
MFYSFHLQSMKSGDEIAEFIRQTYRPLVGQRTKQNQVYFYSVRPLVVVYYDANFDHQYQKASEIVRSKIVRVAKEFPDIT